MVVVLSRYAKVQFCPSKMFRTPVTPLATNLLLSEITVCQVRPGRCLVLLAINKRFKTFRLGVFAYSFCSHKVYHFFGPPCGI